MLSAEFQRFISRAGRVIERALAESVDIYTDYTGGGDAENALDDKCDARVSLVRTFHDERWSRGRCVTSLDWSAAHPELMLASYHNSDDAPHDPDGVCLVWNTKFKKPTPEDVFHCQSPVMSATFARFHPNLILGGTYSGQIVLWDNRVQKRTPVQRTPLSSLAHTHPVYCLSVVGSQNAHNLISVSTDGRMCSWSLDMLSAPQETLDLQHRQSKAVAVTCMGFPYGDVNNFVLGSEDGDVYTGCLYGQRAGIGECVEAHAGPVTALSCHSAPGSAPLSHLYLTASVDWSLRLWSLKVHPPPPPPPPPSPATARPAAPPSRTSTSPPPWTGPCACGASRYTPRPRPRPRPLLPQRARQRPPLAPLPHRLRGLVPAPVEPQGTPPAPAPAPALSCHSAPGSAPLSHLYLTASVDWSLRLWSLKESKPLYSFEESGDYVSDVRWSPVHPALFAAVDAAGRLALWNLNRDTEVPVASIQAEGGVAFNRVSWTPGGTHVTAGDDAGKIWVYELAEHMAQPRHDEWSKLVYTLQELKHNQADDDDRLTGPSSLTSLSSLGNPLR
ncbi:unnamed protein product [Diatraea saccharalis]|uniref:Cytoplasmic dynein 1 intermediate chain 1 n=1 Tax=Diatraea saccharalis TaxID=40085 RepID=A0A9P0CDF4_9NEOP|nr:unnamed protein product [Diatraea saccharalis]